MTSSLPPTAPPGAYIEEPTNPFTPEPEPEPTQAANPRDERSDEGQERSITETPIALSLLSLEELLSEDTRAVVSPVEPNTNPNTAATSFYLATGDSPRFLAIVQSSKTVHFSLNFGRRHCRFYYDAASDDVVLLNTSILSLWVAELDSQKPTDTAPQRFIEVRYSKAMVLPPGLWRLAREEKSGALADLLLLRRRYTTEIKSNVSSAAGTKRYLKPGESSSKKRTPNRNTEDTSLVFLSRPGNEALDEKQETRTLQITTGNPLDQMTAGSRLTTATAGKSPATTEAYSILHLRQIVGSRALYSIFSAKHGYVGQVVVEVIQNRHGSSELRVPRLAREWIQEQDVLKQLRHPFIVEFRGSDARFFSISMEYLPFPDLGTMRNESHLFTGTDNDAYVVLHGMASALSYLEDKGILHNDIKPANILFDRSRGPVLIDFSLATSTEDDPSFGGTPWYIGAELWDDNVRIHLSDVYALGVTLLYLLKKIPLPERVAPTWNIIGVATERKSHLGGASHMRHWVSRIQSVASRFCKSGTEGRVRTMVESDIRVRRSAKSLWQALEIESGGILGAEKLESDGGAHTDS